MQTRLFPALLAGLLIAGVAPAGSAEPAADDDKTFYALGLALSQRFADLGLSQEQATQVEAGLRDGLLGNDPKVPLDTWGPRIEALLGRLRQTAAEREKQAGREFAAQMADEAGAVLTDSGMVYRSIEPGDGEQPTPAATVKLTYTGKLRSGKVFDTSGETPVSFNLGQVVPCFREGISRMQVGGTSRLVCPPDLAYGERGFPPTIPPGATLVFEVKLLEIESGK